MLVLRVSVNEEPSVVAGAEDLGVLNAIVAAVGTLGPASRPNRPGELRDLHLSVGGLTSRAPGEPNEHQRWVGLRELHVGDRVVVEILESDTADPVESSELARQRGYDERAYFEHCKRTYLELKAKYEPAG